MVHMAPAQLVGAPVNPCFVYGAGEYLVLCMKNAVRVFHQSVKK